MCKTMNAVMNRTMSTAERIGPGLSMSGGKLKSWPADQRGQPDALQQKCKRYQNDCRAGFANKDHRFTSSRPKVFCPQVAPAALGTPCLLRYSTSASETPRIARWMVCW